MPDIDFSTARQELLFSDSEKRRVSLLGVGGVGSKVALELAGLGITNLSVFDPDIVENVNPSNQAYGQIHVGQYKAKAIAELCHQKSGVQIESFVAEANGSETLGPVVFMCVNGLPLRRQIMENIILHNPHVELVIEVRMGTTWGKVFCIDPREKWQYNLWMSLSKGEGIDVGVTACGSKVAVGVVTSNLASHAVALFMHHWKIRTVAEDTEPHEIKLMRSCKPANVVTVGMWPVQAIPETWKKPEEALEVDDIEF